MEIKLHFISLLPKTFIYMTLIELRAKIHESFPEYVFEEHEDGMYLVLNRFAKEFTYKLDNGISESEIIRFFDFANAFSDSDDEEVMNLAAIGILEMLTDTKQAKQYARKYLKGKALSLFESFYTSGWLHDV